MPDKNLLIIDFSKITDDFKLNFHNSLLYKKNRVTPCANIYYSSNYSCDVT